MLLIYLSLCRWATSTQSLEHNIYKSYNRPLQIIHLTIIIMHYFCIVWNARHFLKRIVVIVMLEPWPFPKNVEHFILCGNNVIVNLEFAVLYNLLNIAYNIFVSDLDIDLKALFIHVTNILIIVSLSYKRSITRT